MSVEHIGKGYVKICVSEEELENSIAGLSQFRSRRRNKNAADYSRDARKGRRGRHKGNTAACRHGGQLKAVPDTTGSIRQIFTDYGVL